jgi:signal transduction histidine kinase
MDVQWVEFTGLVTGVQTNTLFMLLPGGRMEVQIEGPPQWTLAPLVRAVVSVRGVSFAVWNSIREVRVGSVCIRNAEIKVETPPPVNPFEVVLKTPRELLLFDAQANPFRRVKVKGLVTYADSKQFFLEQGGKGMRILATEKVNLKAGDLIEAAGYPYISRNAILLREAVIRKMAESDPPAAKELSTLLTEEDGLDSTRVRINGRLLGWHLEDGRPVLEMQSGNHLFLARLGQSDPPSLRIGSHLSLDGVYVIHSRNQRDEAGARSFELLLNSARDISVLSQPSWWTLKKLSILAGSLAAVLIFSVVWISQLRRVVEQRTMQLQREMRQRELAEQQRALEVERSRIARDLHDDLGARLTEITMLATNGQHKDSLEKSVQSLFRGISSKARELVAALDIIVWAVNPKDNSLQSVADYLCDFADEYLSPSSVACRFDVPVALPPMVLEGRIRHDLVLAVKETLHNIVRHANASQVVLRLTFSDGTLEIEIADNGDGFDVRLPRNGNGLKNLPERLSKIGGYYDVTSNEGKGTSVRIGLKLPLSERPAVQVL